MIRTTRAIYQRNREIGGSVLFTTLALPILLFFEGLGALAERFE
jgi:hypothetical protein